MSNPTMYCKTCDRERDCLLHKRSTFPPDAAKKWLRLSCPNPSNCDIQYTAGVKIGSRPTGQEASDAN